MTQSVSFKVPSFLSNRLLSDFFTYFNVGKKNRYLFLIEGRILLNGVVINKDVLLSKDDHLEVLFDLDDKKLDKELPIEIVYEDDHLVIIDKPAKLLVHTDDKKMVSLTEYVNTHYQNRGYYIKVLPAHRIDFDTSGLVLFAKHPFALSYLSNLFETQAIEKTYQAIVKGILKTKTGIIDKPIGNDRHKDQMVISSKGKTARSFYKVIKETNGKSFIEVIIEGGRKHQIRVHLTSIGHPVVGDPIYGEMDKRLFLHAYRLRFKPPLGEAMLMFESKSTIFY